VSRPRPTVSSSNEYDAYFRQAQEFAERFAAREGVVDGFLEWDRALLMALTG
jgi:hypothetical protein